ncbi:MAG: pyrimidine/purine nucleoside phosphorylase [Verrucomicrobiota bacterium]|nr:pyrimidine/purine nucleoside phosphorylase [Verrucomicrobiota bacterium]MEC8866022.1 pyrimidine/purine nucleoside phosphorylase [Verrucomicrobiota bacterium]
MKKIDFHQVSVSAKANVYFDGKVVSHSITLSDGSQKTLGLIYPGSYHFNTAKAERMEIIAGSCTVTLDQSGNTTAYNENQAFEVPANSGFSIQVSEGICEYVCSFLDG